MNKKPAKTPMYMFENDFKNQFLRELGELPKFPKYPYKIIGTKSMQKELSWRKSFNNIYEVEKPFFQLLENHENNHLYIPWILGKHRDEYGNTSVLWEEVREVHMLIAGKTRSGKTSHLWTALTAMMHYSHHQYLKIVVLDQKGTQFNDFGDIVTIARGYEEIVDAINKLYNECRAREAKLQKKNSPLDCKSMNAEAYRLQKKSIIMPYIVVIFDEVPAFVKIAKDNDDTESYDKISYLTEMAAGNGISLVMTAQAPYADIIDGRSKNNFERISFALGDSQHDTIIIGTREKGAPVATKLNRGQLIRVIKGERKVIESFYISQRSVQNAVRNLKRKKFNFKLKL